jgi:hypothetical protein
MINADAPTIGVSVPNTYSEVIKVRCRSDSGFPIEVNSKALHGGEWIPIAVGEFEVFRVNGGLEDLRVRGVGGTAKFDAFAVGNL